MVLIAACAACSLVSTPDRQGGVRPSESGEYLKRGKMIHVEFGRIGAGEADPRGVEQGGRDNSPPFDGGEMVHAVVGFRPQGPFIYWLAAAAILLLTSFAFSWISATIGLIVRSVEAAQSGGFIWLFPLTFASSAFVPTQSMPSWLRSFAEHQPVSLIVNAVVNLSTHPVQRALVLAGEADWSSVIEETLRHSTPTSHVLIRFATEDVHDVGLDPDAPPVSVVRRPVGAALERAHVTERAAVRAAHVGIERPGERHPMDGIERAAARLEAELGGHARGIARNRLLHK